MVKKVRKFAHTPAVRALLILIGGVFAVSAGVALSPLMDFSPQAVAQTQCEQEYQKCMQETKKQPPTKTPAQCEAEFKKCVLAKCPESKSQCKKTPECEAHCTESATSKGGINTCCKGGPKHVNGCPNEIDGKCSPKKTMLPGEGMMKGGMMMPMKDMMGGMPMLPMIPMKMPGMMMMPKDMMPPPTGDCDGAMARYFPSEDCQKQQAQTDQSPVSSFLQQSWDRLGNLFGDETETTNTNTDTVPTTVNPNDTGTVLPTNDTTNDTNNTNTNAPVVPATTFPTNTSPPLDTNNQNAVTTTTILEQLRAMERYLRDLLDVWL